jgi:HlyD family secretion protein
MWSLSTSHRLIRRGLATSMSTALVAVTLVACSSSVPPSVRATATVSRATISSGVSSTGSVAATTNESLGFASGGKLTAVKVKVGDHVRAGQVLAKISTFALKQNLAEAKANLAQQEAALGRIATNPGVAGAQNSVRQAKAVLDAAQQQAAAAERADGAAIVRARRQLSVDIAAEHQATRLLRQAEDACEASPCPTIASAKLARTGAQQRVAASRTAVTSAKQKKRVDAAAGQVTLETSRQGVVTAQNALDSASSDKPFTIQQQRALVTTAETAVRSARKNLHDATLRAPFAGTISVVNGAKGEYLAPGSSTTALAPGSRAAIPGADSAGGAPAPGGVAVSRPGGTQFLILTGNSRPEVVVPFEESDAATITAHQKVSVSFDAIPDLTESGTVLSVAPTGTAIAGVINFYVTIALNRPDDRLRVGQTARVAVSTRVAKNVLSVPNAAVRRQGSKPTVVVVESDGTQNTIAFEAGLVGPERTQVVSGLTEGQHVAVPSSP